MLRVWIRASNFFFKHRKILLISLVIYVATFTIFLPLVCTGKPYTNFFHLQQHSEVQLQSMVAKINHERRLAAESHLGGLDVNRTLARYSSVLKMTHVDLLIVIVTVRRSTAYQRLDYLTQVMARLDQEINHSSAFPTTAVLVCNVDAGPGPHDEALQMAKYFPMNVRFPKPDPTHVIKEKLTKEKEDYGFCLNQSVRYNSEYILILQDDALPTVGMLDVVSYALEYTEYLKHGRQWAFLKLYYPERWQGYSYEPRLVLELVGISLLGGSFAHIIFTCVRLKQGHNWLAFCVGVLYSVMLALILGRPNVQAWRRLTVQTHLVVDAKDCCAPAVLYPYPMVARLAHYLQARTLKHGEALDMAMDAFAKHNQYARYLIEPNIVKHIGMYSSLSSAIKSPEEFLA